MAKIAVDARRLFLGKSGLGNYVERCLKEILKSEQKHTYILYTNKRINYAFAEESIRVRRGKLFFLPNVLWIIAEGGIMARKDMPDIFWGTSQILPPFIPQKVKKLLTIHDIIPISNPALCQFSYRIFMREWIKFSLTKAHRIITVSKSTKKDILHFFNIPEERIFIIYPPFGDFFKPIDREKAMEYVRRKFHPLKDKFFFFAGRIEPRKNVQTIIRSLHFIKRKLKEIPFSFLCAGNRGWKTGEILNLSKSLGLRKEEFNYIGIVGDEDLLNLYSSCLAFVFPSLKEGFGFPVMEAMMCGAPVIVSNTDIMREITDGAGLYVEPEKHEDLASCMLMLFNTPEIREELRKRSLERVENFKKNNNFSQNFMKIIDELLLL